MLAAAAPEHYGNPQLHCFSNTKICFTSLLAPARETGENLGVSVLFGSAVSSWGVRRLLKAMRHEAPAAEATASRLGVVDPALYVFKVIHGSIGRLALARALAGRIGEGSDLKTEDGSHARVGSPQPHC